MFSASWMPLKLRGGEANHDKNICIRNSMNELLSFGNILLSSYIGYSGYSIKLDSVVLLFFVLSTSYLMVFLIQIYEIMRLIRPYLCSLPPKSCDWPYVKGTLYVLSYATLLDAKLSSFPYSSYVYSSWYISSGSSSTSWSSNCSSSYSVDKIRLKHLLLAESAFGMNRQWTPRFMFQIDL